MKILNLKDTFVQVHTVIELSVIFGGEKLKHKSSCGPKNKSSKLHNCAFFFNTTIDLSSTSASDD